LIDVKKAALRRCLLLHYSRPNRAKYCAIFGCFCVIRPKSFFLLLIPFNPNIHRIPASLLLIPHQSQINHSPTAMPKK